MARFLRGVSGNPGGRPRDQGKSRQIAREHTAHAVFALARIANDLNASHKQQLEAAREILRLGFGSAPAPAREERCSTEGGIGRFPGLRTRIENLVSELDHQHAHYRRVLLLELAELERSEGLTTAPDRGGRDCLGPT